MNFKAESDMMLTDERIANKGLDTETDLFLSMTVMPALKVAFIRYCKRMELNYEVHILRKLQNTSPELPVCDYICCPSKTAMAHRICTFTGFNLKIYPYL